MIEITCPSKTFLIGEYLALLGAPCLLINTKPHFILKAIESNKPSVRGIPENCPADNYIKQHADFFNRYQMDFFDPHHGSGGFGASSAQFLVVYLLKNGNTNIPSLLQSYQEFAWNKQGIPPSGADIVSQYTGGITYFHKKQNQCEQLTWPFTKYSYVLIKTQHKIPTHQHLLEINSGGINQLPDLGDQVKQALLDKNVEKLVHCIKQFQTALEQNNYVLASTKQLLTEINLLPGVLAAKGCGALGADVIFVLCDSEISIRNWCERKQLKVMSGD